MNRYLVIGATGYIGRHIVAALAETPNNGVFGLSRTGDPHARGWRSLQGDLLDPKLPGLLEELQPDVIFHTAAADRLAPLEAQFQMDVMGTRNLLNALLETQVAAKTVVLGSAAEYGLQNEPVSENSVPKPENDYGIAKAAQTQVALMYAKRYHIPVTVGRIFNVYGQVGGPIPQKDLVIGALASQIARLETQNLAYPRLRTQNLLSSRDFIHIRDVVSALLALADRGCPGEVYNIGSGQSTQVRQLVDLLLGFSSLKNVHLDPQGEQVGDFSQARVEKIKTQIGWTPSISLEDGLRAEWQYWRDYAALMALGRS